MRKVVADLHLHSSLSDGVDSPEVLCQKVASAGLKVFSLTDHDSVEGHKICAGFGNLEFIPGIELTATHKGKEMHILGYYINATFPELLDTLERIAIRRKERLFGIVEKINKLTDLEINWDEVADKIGDGSYNRLNLARFMIQKDLVPSIDAVFSRYLGDYNDSYEAVNFFPPSEAINLIHKSGGIAFLAHPYASGVAKLIPELLEHGLNGIEVYHPSHGEKDIERCLNWAVRFRLGISGGSDYHGNKNSPREILSSGLNGEELVRFLEQNPNRGCVTA